MPSLCGATFDFAVPSIPLEPIKNLNGMKDLPMMIEPTPLVEAVCGINNAENRAITACVSSGISVYVRVPSELMLRVRGIKSAESRSSEWDANVADNANQEFGLALSDDEKLVGEISFLKVPFSDLSLLTVGSPLKRGVFKHCGVARYPIGPIPLEDVEDFWNQRDQYCLVQFDKCRVVRRQGAFLVPDDICIEAENLCIDIQDVERVRAKVRDVLDKEDPWGHRHEAPVVFLLYRAACFFSDKNATAKDVEQWLLEQDRETRYFEKKGKALEYAAQLINRNPKKWQVETSPTLTLAVLNNSKTGKSYVDDVASNRLRLLLLATDYWIHDKNKPAEEPFLTNGLWKFLRSLGFTIPADTGVSKGKNRSAYDPSKPINKTSKWECQVAYLWQIINNGHSDCREPWASGS